MEMEGGFVPEGEKKNRKGSVPEGEKQGNGRGVFFEFFFRIERNVPEGE